MGAAQCRPHTTFSFAQFQTQKVHNEPFVWAKSACDTPFDRLTLWNVNRYYHSSACDSVSCIVKTTTANIYANRQIEFMKHQNLMKKPIFCPFVWTYWCILSMGGFFSGHSRSMWQNKAACACFFLRSMTWVNALMCMRVYSSVKNSFGAENEGICVRARPYPLLTQWFC